MSPCVFPLDVFLIWLHCHCRIGESYDVSCSRWGNGSRTSIGRGGTGNLIGYGGAFKIMGFCFVLVMLSS